MDTKISIFSSFLYALCLLGLFFSLPAAALSADATLSWTQPGDDRVVGYKIYYGLSEQNFTSTADRTIDSPNTTSCVISGLTEGETYYFAATSFDAEDNESDFSETISYTVETSDSAPDPDPDNEDDDGDGFTENEGDCDDTDATIYPGAIEICGDGIDQDCDGHDLACTDDPNDEETEDEETDTSQDTSQDTTGTEEDTDTDGIADETEQAAPNNGDGNWDGTPDAEQDYVASFQDPSSGDFITLESDSGTTLENCQAITPLPANRPSEAVFEWGLFEFTITGIEEGASTQLMVYLPEGAKPTAYKKYGPTPDNPADHWYDYTDDGQTGAVINGNIITLHFTDAARGDDNLSPDGKIIDAGGPVYATASATADDSSSESTSDSGDGGGGGGGGGGCFITILSPFN